MKYEIKTFADDAINRVIYARVPKLAEGEPLSPTQFMGAAAWQPNPHQQVNFQFAIEANDINEAFEKYEGFHAIGEKESRRIFAEQQRQALLMQAAQPTGVDPLQAARSILNGAGRRTR